MSHEAAAVGEPFTDERVSIAVYVCTYRRNDELNRLLQSIERAALAVVDRAAVGVVVIDDNPNQEARPAVHGFSGEFELGLVYRHSGQQNISLARNIGIEAAIEIGDWVAMTDDDIIVRDTWLSELLDLAQRTGATAVTGPVAITFPRTAPRWLRNEPFSDLGLLVLPENEPAPLCSTGNSMISADWLRDHPDIRFEPALGTTGGEDGVFFRTAMQAGLTARFTARAAIDEVAPPERCTLRYQLRRSVWLGNSEFLTNHETGLAGRGRLVLRGGRRIADSIAQLIGRVAHGSSPQLRWTAAGIAQGVGFWIGAVGIRLEHT